MTPTTGLVTTEGGGSDGFMVSLASDPIVPITIDVLSADPSEGTASPTPLSFDSSNWFTPKPVSVDGVDDDIRDGHVVYDIMLLPIFAPTSPYNGFDPMDVTVTNRDDETGVVPPPGEILPEADAYVRNGTGADLNYGTDFFIRAASNTNPDNERESYVRFDLSTVPGSIANARIVLLPDIATTGGASCRAEFVADDSWIESGAGGITWNLKPAASTLLDEWTAVRDVHSELDVTAQAQIENGGDGKLSARLSAITLGDFVYFGSREQSLVERRPRLLYELKTHLAEDDAYYTPQDTSLVVSDPGIGVLGNDDNGVTATESDPPSSGALTLAADGTFTYTPGGGFVGTDVFTYSMTDVQGGSDFAEVRINVGHQPPTATDDADVTDEDTPLFMDVLANDVNPEGDGLTIHSFVDGAHGAVSHDGFALVYTPDAHWHGVDTFTYKVRDDRGGLAEATVTVTVDSVNDLPVAADDAADTAAEVPVYIPVLANDSDDDGEPLTIVGKTDPANGTATIVGDFILYDPGAWTGVATFDYTMEDPNGESDTATVTVTVGANDLTPSWTHADVGNAGSGGDSGATYAGGTFTVSGRGNPGLPLGTALDGFHFAYRMMTGQFEIVARLTGQDGSDPERRAGIMVREDLDDDSRYAAFVVQRFGDGASFEDHEFVCRDQKGGASTRPRDVDAAIAGISGTVWLKLVRRDEDGVHAYRSTDGVTWEYFYGLRLAMWEAVYVGMVVTSDDSGELSTATFDNVSVTQISETLPAPWVRSDVGPPDIPGFADYDGGTGTFTLSGEGNPGIRPWELSDNFHFVYRMMTGQFEIVAYLTSQDGTGTYRRAGLMIREGLDDDSRYAA
ncbi:MAG: Ig-like domain-containing protein, partial [Planctomycetota bacterium]